MEPVGISGVYPRLAVTHRDEPSAGECGIGAVVSFHGRLYLVTYPASAPRGENGRIYWVDEEFTMHELPESTGGTHADRMIHHSDKLVLGANVIGGDGNIFSFDVNKIVGRLTGAACHPDGDNGWVYLASMEDGLYEANIVNGESRTLRMDIIDRLRLEAPRPKQSLRKDKLRGDHAKGLYAGQGMLIYSNNGHEGGLFEWNGQGDAQDTKNWKEIEKTNFTEITGPSGIFDTVREDDPVWALGWDKRSVLLNVRGKEGWKRFRLPKASYTQDADHGWYTEWPRIRKVMGRYLMCMHGMLYEFPAGFCTENASGIRPISQHLKMIADFEEWKDRIVFACDDASQFDNAIVGRCQSNLWFQSSEEIEKLNEPMVWGGLYLNENVREAQESDPFFVGGFEYRCMYCLSQWEDLALSLEESADGVNWCKNRDIIVKSDSAIQIQLKLKKESEWIRVIPDRDVSKATVYLFLSTGKATVCDNTLTEGLSSDPMPATRERVVCLKDNSLKLALIKDGKHYRLDEELSLVKAADIEEAEQLLRWKKPAFYPTVRFSGHSMLVIDEHGDRYQLPYLLGRQYDEPFIREVVTERCLLNAAGTIYELPRPSSGGVRRMRPVTSHAKRIDDFCSWRGMLVMCPVDPNTENSHIVRSEDGDAAVWCGVVDDLWRMGSPKGHGGPLMNTKVLAGEASDPFLTACFQVGGLMLSHTADHDVRFTLQLDFAATGDFADFAEYVVKPGETLLIDHGLSFASHWVRFIVDTDTMASAVFEFI